MDKTLIQLLKVWNKKLVESGFKDCEELVGTQVKLKQRGNIFQRVDPEQFQAKQTYYLLLTQLCNTMPFDNEVDKLVLTWHSEGSSIRAISKQLKAQKDRSHPTTIRFIIRKYEIRWELRTYKPEQLRTGKRK